MTILAQNSHTENWLEASYAGIAFNDPKQFWEIWQKEHGLAELDFVQLAVDGQLRPSGEVKAIKLKLLSWTASGEQGALIGLRENADPIIMGGRSWEDQNCQKLSKESPIFLVPLIP